MSRKNWKNGLATACLGFALSQVPAFAEGDVNFAHAVQATVATAASVPVKQVNRYNGSARPRCYVWNGPWGPGVYIAPRGLHFHRSRYNRPD